jgi:glyoxylase-like metal-dependent hydrolase (beta-lactamase superfamily II)
VRSYPAICASIEHPDGFRVIFDTGYSRAFSSETRHLPYALYRWATPVRLGDGQSLVEQLAKDGVASQDIKTVILSHFHGDHVAGLRDFPHSSIIADSGGYAAVRRKKGLAAVRNGFVPGLLPADYDDRHRGVLHRRQVRLERSMEPFRIGYDLLGDGSLIAVYLPGHACGQIGLLFNDFERGPTFLCADAAWSRRAIRNNVGPGSVGNLAMHDRQAAERTLTMLHELHIANPGLCIVPSHCEEVWAEISGQDNG